MGFITRKKKAQLVISAWKFPGEEMQCTAFSHQKRQYTYWQNHRWLKDKIMCHWTHFQVSKKKKRSWLYYNTVEQCPVRQGGWSICSMLKQRHLCRGGAHLFCEKWGEENETKEESQFLNTLIEMRSHLNISCDIQMVKIIVRKVDKGGVALSPSII